MIVKNVELVISAVKESQYPSSEVLEVALVGRSNVGKSSLINTLINRKKYARTSSEPGKTRTINFYNLDDKLFLVDLPGYGYAKTSQKEKEKWGKMIETYLKTREQLACIVLLVDIRHEPSKDDIQMMEWLKYFNYGTIVVCTKADKISKTQVAKNIATIKKTLKLDQDDKIIAFSADNAQGKDELWNIIDNHCLKESQDI